MQRWIVFLTKRLLALPVSIFIVVTFSFMLVAFMPGDPARVIAGGLASEERLNEIRRELGLDKPVLERYADYVADVARGDLGTSYLRGRPITFYIGRFLPNTIELMIVFFMLSIPFGLLIGTVGAYYAPLLPDKIARTAITAFQSIPDWLFGLLMIYVFFYLLGWAPAPVGRLGFVESYPERTTGFLLIDTVLAGEVELFLSAVKHLALPGATGGVIYSAYFARTTRTALVEALHSPQIEFARACGLAERTVLRYAFTVARTSIITYGAILMGYMFGGVAIVEIVFTWRGFGQWSLESLMNLDLPAIQGFIIVVGTASLLVYILLDVLIMVLDPRVELK
jgi:peptide/nickel transport system permease protein